MMILAAAFSTELQESFLLANLKSMSCTTLPEKAGRQARLIELAPNYCDVIVRRWQEFTGKTATLEATGEQFNAIEPHAVEA